VHHTTDFIPTGNSDVNNQLSAEKSSTTALAGALSAALGAEHVVTQAEQLAAFSADIYRQGVVAELVIAPGSVAELASAVALCTREGRSVIPRGGGFSYTGGYIPAQSGSIIIDMRRLNRIVEINAEDMYVTVECGCTWKTLFDALKAKGLRTPYFGPISGFASTVGGALSQGSFFMGSTQYGTTAETALGLEVILADGSLLKTGSAASIHAPSPFFRAYGPDLTGVFLGDTGALGFKARATLKLIPYPDQHRYATYSMPDDATMLRALAEIARRGLAADCYGWDPLVVRNFANRDMDVKQDLGYLAGVVKSGSSMLGGLKDAARIAVAGNRFARQAEYLLHATVDEMSAAAAEEKIVAIQKIAEAAGGTATEPSVPRALRGTPFSYPNKILGSAGERWVPTNGLCPHSRAPQVLRAFREFMAAHAALTTEHKIEFGIIFFAVGNNTTCIEPLFYWPDARLPSHDHLMQPGFRGTLPYQDVNPAATEAMRTLRTGISDLFMRHGCVHVQIGKTYPYKQSREPSTFALLEAIKHAVDSQGLVNPGSLGL
jgi:FAD/FMN-containing dehydrogenase